MYEITLDDYVSGGYYLAQIVTRPEYVSSQLMPDRILSASNCICNFFPDTWAIEWASDADMDRIEKATQFRIPCDELPKVKSWATRSFSEEFGWPRVFYSVDAARRALAMFLPGLNDVILFGLGIHRSHVVEFLNVAKPRPQQPGFAPEGNTGVFECVSRGEELAVGGVSLGYELLVTQYGLLTCSWLCNGLEKALAESLEVIPNPHGFVSTLDEAFRCVRYISEGHVGAEPGLWLPWLIMKYG